MRFIDLTGKKFGRLTVLSRESKDKAGHINWKCRCDCGNEIIASGCHLKSGHTTSCGCFADEKRHICEDLTGQRFGRWTVLRNTGIKERSSYLFECQCDCGTIKNIRSGSLKSGNSKSCGCLAKELSRKREKNLYNPKAIKDMTGQRFGNLVIEGMEERKPHEKVRWICRCDCGNKISLTRTMLLNRNEENLNCGCIEKFSYNKEYPRLRRIWGNMKQRCLNPKNDSYAGYGGRGITICQEWQEDFANFAKWAIENGYSDNLTIERKDVNGNYEPSNCCWITSFEQQSNTRKNVFVTYKGERKTLSEWCRILNLKYATISYRLKNGYSVEDAFEKKANYGNRLKAV